jgi:DNA-binding LacI/PurR family transcriptional regulator
MADREQPTLADVARHAGVSIATASRALSGSRPVSADRQRRVDDAASAIGYRHNAVASALRSQRTETVGLVLPRYSTGFLSALIESVSEGLEREHAALVLRYSAPDALHDVDNVGSLVARRVDGIIICPPSIEASRESIAAAGGVPVVQVGRFIETDRSDSVGLDEDRAMSLLAEHLAHAGVQSALVVGLDEKVPADARRIAALRLAGSGAGLAISVAPFAGAELQGGIRSAEVIVDDRVGTDAVVCANDDVAAGVIAVLRMHHVDVPGRVQVASLLDLTPDAENHAITTLRHPWPAMGREAVRLLSDAQKPWHDGAVRRVSLAPRLVLGASTRG